MASRSDEDLHCPVCQSIFTDPVLLSRSQRFCRGCLKSWWRADPTNKCPICMRRSSREDPARNLALKNLCEDRAVRTGPTRGRRALGPLSSSPFLIFWSETFTHTKFEWPPPVKPFLICVLSHCSPCRASIVNFMNTKGAETDQQPSQLTRSTPHRFN